MSTIRIKVDPDDPSTFPKGFINYAAVDATTEEDIARHEKEDEAEALQEMARYTRQLRRKLNLSQKDLARRINVSPETIRNWEQGKRYPTGAARALLHVLHKEPDMVLRILA